MEVAQYKVVRCRGTDEDAKGRRRDTTWKTWRWEGCGTWNASTVLDKES